MQRKEVNKMNKTTKIKQVLLLAIISSFSFACSQDSHLEWASGLTMNMLPLELL